MAKRIAFTAHGKVQGVFFRDFTQKNANSHGLTGWVRNTADGKVQGEAQGDEESIKKILEDLSQGPRHAKVTKLDKSEIEPKVGESRFQVL